MTDRDRLVGVWKRLCSLVIAAALAGCGSSNFSSAPTTPTAPTAPTAPTSSTPASTTISLTGTPLVVFANATVALSASVAPAAATGTVTFLNQTAAGTNQMLGTAALNNGTATLATAAIPLGTNTVTAVYAGSSSYATSTSTGLTVVVSNAAPVTPPPTVAASATMLTATASSAVVGASVGFTATVSPAAATGTVTFMNGATTLGSVALSSGMASFTTTLLPAGSNAVTAVYTGSSAYTASTSSPVTVVVTSGTPGTPTSYTGVSFSAQVMAGTTPVVGASVALYAAGTGGNGAGAILLETIATDANGKVTVPATYSCPTSASVLYLVSTGGTVAPATFPATQLTMMSVAGLCSGVTSATTLTVNEATTVAAAYALAPFYAAGGLVGASSTNSAGLLNAVVTAAELTDPIKGVTPGTTLPATITNSPAPKIDTLANLINACAIASKNCTSLLSLATPASGKAPANTLDAMVSIVRNPANNVSALYTLAQNSTAYSSSLSAAPADWTMFLTIGGGGMNGPSGLGIDSTGSVWVASYFNVASKFTPLGAPVFANGLGGGGLNASYGLAMDPSDNAWIPDETGNGLPNAVTELNSTGGAVSGTTGYLNGGLNFPISTAVDPNTTVWVVDYGNSHVTLLDRNGNPLSGASGYTTPLFAFPVAVVVDQNHFGWIANQSSSTVTKVAPDGSSFTNLTCCNGASGLAIDHADNVWVANYYGSSVSLISNAGAGSVVSTGYNGGTDASGNPQLNHPQGIAIDGAGNVWVANYRARYLTELQGVNGTAGTPITPVTGYGADAGLLEAYALAIDASGNLWVTNFGSNTLTKFIGLAVPVKTPIAGAATVP